MNLRVIESLIVNGEEFKYSLSYGNVYDLSINVDPEVFFILDPNNIKELESIIRMHAKHLADDDMIISGVPRGDGMYEVSIGKATKLERIMTPKEFLQFKLGQDVCNGNGIYPIMTEYAEYYYDQKLANNN